jgi:hypothetical protein
MLSPASLRPVFLVRLPNGEEYIYSRDEAVIALADGGWVQAMSPSMKCAHCGETSSPRDRHCPRCRKRLPQHLHQTKTPLTVGATSRERVASNAPWRLVRESILDGFGAILAQA